MWGDLKVLNRKLRREAESLNGNPPRVACKSYLRRLNSVPAISKCLGRRNVVRCSNYIGPPCHLKIFSGPDYADSLAKAGLTRK
jgi:hypothetical protein